jgi:hypothetical protein
MLILNLKKHDTFGCLTLQLIIHVYVLSKVIFYHFLNVHIVCFSKNPIVHEKFVKGYVHGV